MRLSAEDFPGMGESETYGLYDRGRDQNGSSAPPPIRKAMEAAGVVSAAQYRYHLSEGDEGSLIRARVEVFKDAAAARAQFRARHLPEALEQTQTLPLGQDAFALGNAYLGFLQGVVIVEMRAEPAHPLLHRFAEAYVAKVQSLSP